MNAVSPTLPTMGRVSIQADAIAAAASSTDHPDATLLATISTFRAARAARHEELDAVNRLPKRHPDYKKRWEAILASSAADSRVEKAIARTAAVTLAGAIAKAKLGFDMLGGDDPQGDDLLHDEGGSCRMWAVAMQGTRDLLRLLGERCGPSWEEPDAELLDVCDSALAAVDESDRLSNAAGDLVGSDPRYTTLSAAARETYEAAIGLAERAAKIPATTIAGMRAKAGLALRVLPADDVEDGAVVGLLLADVAGIEPPLSDRQTSNDERRIEEARLREATSDAAIELGEEA